jgi:predicted nucleic acid-binding protein
VIVVDSSAALDYVLGERERARWVEMELERGGWDLHAPHVLDIEVVATLRRIALAGRIRPALARRALDVVADLRLQRYPHVHLVDRMWALRDSVHPPDSAFVALAEALDAPLVTTDRRLARSHGHRAEIVAP